MGLKKLLTETVFQRSRKDIMNMLRRNGILLDEELDYYVGSGANGDVYKVKDKNKVLKIEGFNENLFNILDAMMKATADNKTKHIAKIYFNRRVEGFTLTVLEYLEPNDIKYDSGSYFDRFLMYMENSFLSYETTESGFYGYVLTNEFKGKRDLKENLLKRDKHLADKFEKVYLKGNNSIIRVLYTVLNSKMRLNNGRLVLLLNDLINNEKFIKDLYYGIEEFYQDVRHAHGDVHINNILKDPKTGNYKLIDPWAI